MGSFYSSITTKGPTQQEIARYMETEQQQGVISPTTGDVTTSFLWGY